MEFIIDNLTKSAGTYRCPDNIKNFKIRIRIKEGNPTPNVNNKREGVYKEKEFSWQEKFFSKTQKAYYRDERNCFTDREKEFHRMICDGLDENDDDFLFSYVNEEDFYPEDEVAKNMNYLENGIKHLNLNHQVKENEYDFFANIQKAIENPLVQNHEDNMYLMVDLGEYFGNTWIKQEIILCSLKYNADSKLLQLFPDFTNTHPYILKVEAGDERVFSYFIENCSNNIPESIDANEKTLIKKIYEYQNYLKSQLISDIFKLPPKDKLYVFLFLEISSGKRFEYPEVFVQYFIQLPDGWASSEPEKLKGRTHICTADNRDGLLHFGHCVDVLLEYSFSNSKHAELPKSPYIYFEVISKDSWDRYRCEGVCYKNLPICQSGTFEFKINCFRFTTKSPVGEMRRFFIGDCQNYSDITWIGIPNGYEESTLNKYNTETICTGELNVRLNVMHQSQEFLEREENVDRTRSTIFERLGSSTLIKSVEQVIQEFKKARKAMLEARKNI